MFCLRSTPQSSLGLNFRGDDGGNGEIFQKTLAFRSFQIFQEVSMMRDAKDFLQTPSTKMKDSYHSSTEWKTDHSDVSTEDNSSKEIRMFQILREYDYFCKVGKDSNLATHGIEDDPHFKPGREGSDK
jgi:hypothetical protein